jgi:hypothetical protein
MQWVMAGLLRDSFVGVHATDHSSRVLSIVCAATCTAILLFCSMVSRQKDMYMCIGDVQQREIYARLLKDITVTSIEITTHSIHSPLLCFMHVFICFYLCSADSTRRGRGREICHIVFFTAHPDSVCLAQNFIVTVTIGG